MTTKEKVDEHLNILRALQHESGLFYAAAPGVTTGYDKAWLRDNFYTSLCFEESGETETIKKVWRAILDLFLKHEEKISWAIEHKPHATWQYIHARYHPETFEEFWEEWGNKQNDAVGAVLFKLADLEVRGIKVLETEDDKRIVQKLVNYLNTIEYWNDADNGVWEEYEEVHASSVGAVVAALKKIKELGSINIPVGMVEKGEMALEKLLPRESSTKFADLALLSLSYPYQVMDRDVENIILQNIEYHLVKERGVIRYKTDKYYNKNKIDEWSEEAEWTMGFPWLAIIYARRGDKEKARVYLEKTEKVLTAENKLPELYFSNSEKPNENIPLAWAESLYIIALLEMDKISG
ncbi:MAG: glycoside hydrolase family 15 protein [Candidatus Paceibacterota bacterium]|jgi:phosphorylase kinase alpha/beta subunit|nr:glycoside hydrolase family 15 protein [Candidatus Paceibacterota bacterium]